MLTGALGLIITLGAKSWPVLVGVPGPPPLPDSPKFPMLCWDGTNGKPLTPGDSAFEAPWGDASKELLCLPCASPLSSGGRGLFRKSFSVVVEDVGVLWLEDTGDWE